VTDRQTTVLFADVSDSTKLYEAAGDAAALEAIGHCVTVMKRITESIGGRVVKMIGDGVMALFPSPGAAAAAAAEMQAAADMLAPVGEIKLALRVGFHSGPVIQKNDDVFGDTVNLAARLVAQAVKGQIVMSGDSQQMLAPIFRSMTRDLYSITVKGKSEEVALSELVWRGGRDVTVTLGGRRRSKGKGIRLRLKHKDKELVRRREGDSVTLGRDVECDMVVMDHSASRLHCTIERRHDQFVLKDHSTNGTFVTVEGEPEVLLQREEFALRKHGWIALGQSRSVTAEVVEFFCEGGAS
jgi:adenylate cyclase